MDRRDKEKNIYRSFRFPKPLYAKMEVIAEREHRDVSNLLLHMVQEFIERDEATQAKE